MDSLEPWGDVLGDNPIARKTEHLKQIGNGGGDPTRPLDKQFQPSTAATTPTTTTYSPSSGVIQPGPDPTVQPEPVIEDAGSKEKITNQLASGHMDTLDNKCFYCEECPNIYGQKCYMTEHQYDPKYLDGVCLGLSFLWVKARNWDTFVETLSTVDGQKIIKNIMDGQEKYMAQTNFPPNYAKGLMTELYNIPAIEIDVEMVELSSGDPRGTFEQFIERAIVGPEGNGNGNGGENLAPCIVIVFSKAHAMAIRVTGGQLHFFDPNYGQFGMATMVDFVDRLWHFVQPPNAVEESALPAYGNVWAYVRHVERDGEGGGGGGGGGGGTALTAGGDAMLPNGNELGGLATVDEKEEDLPFVPTNAGVLPMAEPEPNEV